MSANDEAVPELTPVEARRRLGDFFTVDVRAAHEFRGPLGHIEGAALLPLPELEARAGELPRDTPLLLVCRSGARSARACAALRALGMGPAVNLAGGMIAWNRAGLPTERPAPASLAALLDLALAWIAQVSGRAPDVVREEARAALAAAGASLEVPTKSAIATLLDDVERSLQAAGPPPDLDLSLAAFRRWLDLR